MRVPNGLLVDPFREPPLARSGTRNGWAAATCRIVDVNPATCRIVDVNPIASTGSVSRVRRLLLGVGDGASDPIE